jgi:hypothetical protein
MSGSSATSALSPILAFIRHNDYAIRHLLPTDFNVEKEFPYLATWHGKLMSRPAVQQAFKHVQEFNLGCERQNVNSVTHSSSLVPLLELAGAESPLKQRRVRLFRLLKSPIPYMLVQR